MCENMAICVKNWLSLGICVNVWKHGHLCGNFTFIGYFYEICSMCENMDVSEVCAVFSSLVFSFWWSACFLAKQKRDTPTERASHTLVKGDVPTERVSHILLKGDTCCGCASPFYLMCTKKESPTNYSLWECSLSQHVGCPLARIHQMYVCQWASHGLVPTRPPATHRVPTRSPSSPFHVPDRPLAHEPSQPWAAPPTSWGAPPMRSSIMRSTLGLVLHRPGAAPPRPPLPRSSTTPAGASASTIFALASTTRLPCATVALGP
jgi:hypothetical protein